MDLQSGIRYIFSKFYFISSISRHQRIPVLWSVRLRSSERIPTTNSIKNGWTICLSHWITLWFLFLIDNLSLCLRLTNLKSIHIIMPPKTTLTKLQKLIEELTVWKKISLTKIQNITERHNGHPYNDRDFSTLWLKFRAGSYWKHIWSLKQVHQLNAMTREVKFEVSVIGYLLKEHTNVSRYVRSFRTCVQNAPCNSIEIFLT